MFQVTALQVCVVSLIFSFYHFLLFFYLSEMKRTFRSLRQNYHFMMTDMYFNYFEISFSLVRGAKRRTLMWRMFCSNKPSLYSLDFVQFSFFSQFMLFLFSDSKEKYRLLHGKCARTVFTHELLTYQKSNE